MKFTLFLGCLLLVCANASPMQPEIVPGQVNAPTVTLAATVAPSPAPLLNINHTPINGALTATAAPVVNAKTEQEQHDALKKSLEHLASDPKDASTIQNSGHAMAAYMAAKATDKTAALLTALHTARDGFVAAKEAGSVESFNDWAAFSGFILKIEFPLAHPKKDKCAALAANVDAMLVATDKNYDQIIVGLDELIADLKNPTTSATAAPLTTTGTVTAAPVLTAAPKQ